MTLLEGIVDQTRREYALPVLETERLLLRAPRRGDVKAIAALAERPPHCCKHRAHSASVQCRGRRAVHWGGQ